MARYRVDSKTGKMLIYSEHSGQWEPEPEHKALENNYDFSKVPVSVFSDIREFVSVAGHKPELITSRSQLGRHERSNNMRQVGDDLKGRITERVNKEAAKRAEIAAKSGIKVTWTDYNPKTP